jgi:anti-anti-sigma factor
MAPVVLEYRPQAYRALEDAVRVALESGAPQVVLNLDSLDALDTEGVRGLISLLRYARSVGGDLALRSSKPDVLRTLSVTALDRIFALVEAEAA